MSPKGPKSRLIQSRSTGVLWAPCRYFGVMKMKNMYGRQVRGIERMIDEEHPNHTGSFPLSFYFSAVESVEAVDDMTVKFNLKWAAPVDLIASSLYGAWIVSPKALEAGDRILPPPPRLRWEIRQSVRAC